MRLRSLRAFPELLVVLALSGTLCASLPAAADPYQPDADGQIVMEAEHFDLATSASSRDWVVDLTLGYVGDSAVQSVPDSYFKVTSNLNADSPRMDYEVEYSAQVTVNIWVRGLGLSGSQDSVWVGVDGDEGTALVIGVTRDNWGWETAAGQLTVPAGVHTINVWMREDGTIVDRVLVTPLATVPSGDGPPESSRGGSGNTAPTAFDDSFAVNEDSSTNSLAVLADNGAGADFDPDGDSLLVSGADNPGSAGGTVIINGTADGLEYTPAPDFIGVETFGYTVSDGVGGFDRATVTVTVNNANNDVPVLATVGDRSATEGQTLAFTVTATDVDGAPPPEMQADLGLVPGTPSFADNGNGTGSFSWTPVEGDAPGPYSVTFSAIDAVDNSLVVSETISIDVQASGSGGSGAYQPDPDGQVVIEVEHFDVNTSAGGRDWVEDFTSGYVGDSAMQSVPNSFLKVTSGLNANSPRLDYEVEYPGGTSLNIWVRGLGLSGSRDSVWVGVNGNESTAQVISVSRNDWGWETAAGQLTIPAGTHTVNVWMREDGTIIDRLLLTPLGNLPTGDGPPESTRGGGAPANMAPVARDDSFSVSEDSSGNALAVLADNGGGGPDFDPDGDPISITSADSQGNAGGNVAINGTASGLVYTPAADYAGTEAFSYTISDGKGGSDAATVTVTVNNSNNDPPMLTAVGDRSATEQQTLAFLVTATDVDGAPWPVMTADLAALPGSPSFTDNNDGTASFSWTPAPGDAPGPYLVSFTATDAVDAALSASETISIDVQAAGGSGTGAYLADGDGQVVIEVEHFDANTSAGSRDWIADFTAGFVGDSAMQSVPNTFHKVTSNLNANSPRMDYEVEFFASTSVNIWVRGLGLSGSRDSVWVGVDGDDSTAEVIGLSRDAWGWTSAAGQITVPAGVHTINVWMREDGSIVDRVFLTPMSTTPSGDGPPESSRGQGGGSGLPLADDFADGSADGWTIIDDSIQFPSNWSVVSEAFVQSEHTNSSGADVTETYHRGTYALWDASAGLTDYRLSVDITPAPDAGDDVGVMFRVADSNNFYRISLNLLNGFARLEKNLNGTYITLASDHRGYLPGVQHTIVAEVEGPLIQIFVNDDPLFAVVDADHSSGGIALFSRDASRFDNVSLSENDTVPRIVIAEPEAHNVLPGAPLDLDVSAVIRNAPATNVSVRFQYHNGGSPSLCAAAVESLPGYYTSRCLGMPAGDYTIEALLLESGVELDRDRNASVAVGSPASQSHRYDAIGNSISRGVGDNTATDNLAVVNPLVRSSAGWTTLLSDLLVEATGSPNLVGNEAISGDRVSDTLNARLFSIIERNPESDRALVMLGTNDSNTFGTTTVADFTTNLQSIIDELRLRRRDTVYVALLPPAWGRNTNPSTIYPDPLDASATRNQTIMSYNAAIQGMLPQAGVQLGPDFFSCFLTPTVNRFSLFDDPLHPNSLGYKFMAALWRDAIVSGQIIAPMDPCPSPIFILENLDAYAYGHRQNLLEEGDEYYRDASFILTNIPPELADGVWVQSRIADNGNADPDFLSFSVGSTPSTVYIAYDPTGSPPTSLTHTLTAATLSESLTTNDPAVGTFGIVRAGSVTGTVTIGGTKSAGSPGAQQAYLVIVVPD